MLGSLLGFVMLFKGGRVVDMMRRGREVIMVARFPVYGRECMEYIWGREEWRTGI